MSQVLSPVAQAMLLLTSPLLTGTAGKGAEALSLGECKKLVFFSAGSARILRPSLTRGAENW